MNNLVKVMDGFAKDENGKFHILPMRIERDLISPPSASRSATRSYIKHKFIPIEPLLKECWTSPHENQSKKRKIDRPERPVRKELFKVPDKTNVRRLSYNQQLNKNNKIRKSISNSVKKIVTHKPQKKKDSLELSLLDTDEGFIPTNSSKSKLQKTVLFPINEENSNLTMNKTPDRIDKTHSDADSAKSDIEFLLLERQLASAKKTSNTNASPMTSVCTLLEKTKITNCAKKESQKTDITNLIQQDMEQFESIRQNFENFNQQFELFNQQYKFLNQQFLLFQKEHTQRVTTLLQLLPQEEDKKENNIRKSLRLAEKTKTTISPAIVKKVDLRKSTLNKNLSKTFADSPRTRNAVNMYNSFRSDCPSLLTPKMDKMGSPTSAKNLSNRIHSQCLLLQDTPQH